MLPFSVLSTQAPAMTAAHTMAAFSIATELVKASVMGFL
jgi:hypothetical protein